jgi:hypothetical protein
MPGQQITVGRVNLYVPGGYQVASILLYNLCLNYIIPPAENIIPAYIITRSNVTVVGLTFRVLADGILFFGGLAGI